MLRQWDFHLATRLRFGRGVARRLGETAAGLGRCVLLAGYRDCTGMEEVYAKARRQLDAAGLRVAEFFEVPPEPDAETTEGGARAAVECGAEVVVGLGGGSVLDAAKGIALLARLGGRIEDYADANPQARPATDALPVVAVPTTAGTGSEVTPVAVFTLGPTGTAIPSPASGRGAGVRGPDVPETDSHFHYPIKTSILSPAIAPKVALVDPDLTLGCAPALTAACAADALGHAIESCMSRLANPFSSLLAGHAVERIVRDLPRAIENPRDPGPREALALAATLAGAALSEAGVTMTHAIAHALGAVLGVPHGLAVAVGTPVGLQYNRAECAGPFARLARDCSVAGATPQEQADAFVGRIEELLRSAGLPDRVEAPPGAPPDLAARLARNAAQSAPAALKFNPRKIDEEGLRRVFEGLLRREAGAVATVAPWTARR